jgi:nitrite reductase (NADH) small subunit
VISLETGEAQGADEGRTMSYPVRLDGQTILLGLAPSHALVE